MTNSPMVAAGEPPGKGFPGELETDFATVLNRLQPLADRRSFTERMIQRFSWARRSAAASGENRHVAFDGYRNTQFDDKLERDRRYGTVYTVTEAANAYMVRLELPRRMPASSLKQMWQVADVPPEYDFTIAVSHNVLAIRGRLHGEALRRLAYVSASFPSGFLTRIEFADPVAGFKHKLCDHILEVIVLKSGQPSEASAC